MVQKVTHTSSSAFIFQENENTWLYEEIREIHQIRYLLKHCALEIFLVNGKTFLLAFANQEIRDHVLSLVFNSFSANLILPQLKSKPLPHLVDYEAQVLLKGGIMTMSITEKWQNGLLSNFEYLMHVNTLAGRTVNDLNQYTFFFF